MNVCIWRKCTISSVKLRLFILLACLRLRSESEQRNATTWDSESHTTEQSDQPQTSIVQQKCSEAECFTRNNYFKMNGIYWNDSYQ